MPYRSLVFLASPSPQVERLIWKLERHYLKPAHTMLRLPVPNCRLVDPCHFALAHLLLGAIAGVSTTLYKQAGKNGDRFRRLLIEYYPFSLESGNAAPAADAAKTLWDVFRNPLAHNLDFDVRGKAKTPEVKVLRALTQTETKTRGLTEKRIEALEDTSARPKLKPTVAIRTDATVLSVDALY